MRISDWSSDVCSSDLVRRCAPETGRPPPHRLTSPSLPCHKAVAYGSLERRASGSVSMKSSRQWARDMFASVRGRDARDPEADRWGVAQMEQNIARIKRAAFAAGADRYKPRLLHIANGRE